MKLFTNNKGASLIEIIVAIGIFTIIAANIVVLTLSSQGSTLRESERLQADMYLQQSFEATKSIGDYDFTNLQNGTYGLTKQNGYWELSGNSDTQGQFTRTVTIADVERNALCAIVDSGGTIYGSTKKITSTIAWDLEAGNSTSITADYYLTNWNNPQSCGLATADDLVVNILGAIISGGQGDRLAGITLENTSSSDLTIDRMTISWSGGSATNFTRIRIDNNNVWTTSAANGTEVDITDIIIPAGTTYDLTEIRFDDAILGSTISITFTISDGSTKTVNVIPL